MANSNITLQDPSYKGYYFSFYDSEKYFPTLVPIYQFNQCYQYGSKNIRLLYGTKSIRKIGYPKRRYSQSKIPFQTNREIIGKRRIMKKKEMSLRLNDTKSWSINKTYGDLK